MGMRALLVICLVAACNSPNEDHGALQSIDVEPANLTLEWNRGVLMQEYAAIGHWEDGTVGPVDNALFTLDAEGSRLGQFIGPTLSVTGQAAGKGGISASLGDVVGATSVIITVHPINYGPDVMSGAETKFPDVSPPGSMSQTIVYPLANAVMPTSVKSPTIMWEGAATSTGLDLYRIRILAGLLTVDTILASTPSRSYRPGPNDWQLITNSVPDGKFTITIDHWDAVNGVHGGAPIEVNLVEADVLGAIYYWNLDAGDMERIDVGGRGKAIPTPPEAESGNRCVACHTLSRDGRYLSAALWGAAREGAVFDMTNNLVRNSSPIAPAPTVAPLIPGSTYRQIFTTFNPDATRLLVNTPSTSMMLLDPLTGLPVTTTGTPLPSSQTSHPSWSPDGTKIAFISGCRNELGQAAGGMDYHVGDLSILPVTGADSFGTPSAIADADAQGGGFTAPSWPTWSPDSNYIAYGAGVFSRGEFNGVEYPGALFLIGKDGGTPVRLDNTCAGAVRCYLPNFAPFDSGDHFWLVFYSFQDYGNAQAGTKGTRRRQMWVSAIDKAKLGTGEDPSSVPYWLPDQDTQSKNMSAFWTLPPAVQ